MGPACLDHLARPQLPVAGHPARARRCRAADPGGVADNTVTTGTVLLLAIGVALVAGWLFGGSWFAAIPGLLLLALGVARADPRAATSTTGPVSTALSLAAAFVVIWVIGLCARSAEPLAARGRGDPGPDRRDPGLSVI